MSTYFTDFEEYSTGSKPSDWTVRINADDLWTVETTGSDKYLQLDDPDSNQYLSWDDIDADAERQDVEILFKWQRSAGTSGVKPWAFARLTGNSSAFSGYRTGGTTSNFQIYRAISATTWSSIGSVSFTHSGSVDYWVRFRVNGTSVQARLWEDGSSEPGTWDIDVTDSNISGDGWAGLGNVSANGATFRYWQMGVGTNGDTAPASAGPSGISGSVSKTLGGASVAAAGVIKLAGSASITLGGAALSASADLQIKGATSATLAGATLSSSGTLSAAGISGALSSSLDGATASAAGALAVSGALSQSLDGATVAAAGSGQQITAGALSATLAGASSSAAGALYVSAQVSRALDGAAVSAAGHVDITAALGVALDGASIVAAGAVPGAAISGALTRTLAGATLTASGSETAEAEAAPGYTITGRLRAFEVRGRARRFEVDQ